MSGAESWATLRRGLVGAKSVPRDLPQRRIRSVMSGEQPPNTDYRLTQVRVLVVEDNPANQMVAVAMLKRLGLRADVVGDGAEAVAAVTRVRYDAVLMDCQMPVLDGFEATRRIRAEASAGHPRLPIIAMTAAALDGERERCLAAGMDGYLAKPINVTDLAQTLRRWVPTLTLMDELSTTDADQNHDLDDVRESLGDAWPEICEVFVAQSTTYLGELARAAAEDDPAAVRKYAHSLRGGCGAMGLTRCAELAGRIEDATRTGARSPWPEMVRAFEVEYLRMVPRLLPNGWSS